MASRIRSLLVDERTWVGAGTAGLVLLYALRGGSFDVVPRQEAGIAIWLVLAIGFAMGTFPRERLSRPAIVAICALAALIAWTAASFSWTESDERTYTELARTVHHAGVFLLGACLLTRRNWTAAARGLLAGCVTICGLAVASRLTTGVFPEDPVTGVFGGNRLNYPLNYWNAVAAWGTVTATMALAWSAHAESRAIRMLALGSVPVAALASYLTYSRQGAAGMAVGALMVWALGRNRGLTLVHLLAGAGASAIAIRAVRDHPEIVDAKGTEGAGTVALALLLSVALCAIAAGLTALARADERLRLPRRAAQVVGVLVAIAVLAFAATEGRSLASKGWREFRGQELTPTSATDPAARLTSLNGNRYELWSSAFDAFRDRPLKGHGPGTFGFWWAREGANAERVRDAHSLPLEALAETGVPGLAILLVLLGAIGVATALARRRNAEIGVVAALGAGLSVGSVHASVDWVWESTANAFVLLVAAALLTVAWSRETASPSRAARVIATVLALAAAAAMLPNLASTSLTRDSEAQAREERTGAALASATDAIESEPWAATPYLQRALLSEDRRQYAAAIADIERAIDREPTNWRHWVVLARLRAESGDAPAAVAAWRESKRLLKFPFTGP